MNYEFNAQRIIVLVGKVMRKVISLKGKFHKACSLEDYSLLKLIVLNACVSLISMR